MKRIPVFDNNVLSSNKDSLTAGDLKDSVFSIITFYETTATKSESKIADDEKWRKWQMILTYHEQNQSLLVPSSLDWQICAFAIRAIRQQTKIQSTATELQNDALLCQSAISYQLQTNRKLIIVTENLKDFGVIIKYLNSRLKKGEPHLLIQTPESYFSAKE